MSNSLFEQIGGRQVGRSPAQTMQNNTSVFQNLPAFRNDPVSALRQVGLNIPSNLTPKGIADYLVQSGQISGDELNHVISTARMMGVPI